MTVKAISADSHIHLTILPSGTFTSRLPTRLGPVIFAPPNALASSRELDP